MQRIEVIYPFIPEVSVNHAYNRGCQRYGKKTTVKHWADGLTLMVKNKLQFLPREMEPPVGLRFLMVSPKRTGRIDASNYAKILIDAVFAALPFDDNDLNLVVGPLGGIRGEPGEFRIVVEETSLYSIYSKDDYKFFFDTEHE